MQRGETEGVKGRGQTAAEPTQRPTGEEESSEWEISPTLEERPVSSSMRSGKGCGKRKEDKKGKEGTNKDGKGGQDVVCPRDHTASFFLGGRSSQNSFDYKCLIEKHGFSQVCRQTLQSQSPLEFGLAYIYRSHVPLNLSHLTQ